MHQTLHMEMFVKGWHERTPFLEGLDQETEGRFDSLDYLS